MVQNHRGLMHLEGRVFHFDGVMSGVYCSPKFSLGFWLLNFVTLLFVNRYGGAINLIPPHLLNLSKIDLFVDEVCSPCSSDVWVTLVRFTNAKKVQCFFYTSIIIFLSFYMVYKLLFNCWNNVCAGDNHNVSLRRGFWLDIGREDLVADKTYFLTFHGYVYKTWCLVVCLSP